MMLRLFGFLLALASCIVTTPADAHRLATGQSEDLISITSDFTGTRVIVFGAMEEGRGVAHSGEQDIIVILRGPSTPLTVWRKEQIGGIWVNNRSVTFENIPQFYALSSSHPVDDISHDASLEERGIGWTHLPFTSETELDATEASELRDAIARIKKNQHLYQEDREGVRFLGRTLFETSFDIPANIPLGQYSVEIYLFSGGHLIDTHVSSLNIDQAGLSGFIYEYAHKQPALYGLAAILLALSAGWLAAVLFRQI